MTSVSMAQISEVKDTQYENYGCLMNPYKVRDVDPMWFVDSFKIHTLKGGVMSDGSRYVEMATDYNGMFTADELIKMMAYQHDFVLAGITRGSEPLKILDEDFTAPLTEWEETLCSHHERAAMSVPNVYPWRKNIIERKVIQSRIFESLEEAHVFFDEQTSRRK